MELSLGGMQAIQSGWGDVSEEKARGWGSILVFVNQTATHWVLFHFYADIGWEDFDAG